MLALDDGALLGIVYTLENTGDAKKARVCFGAFSFGSNVHGVPGR